MAPGNLHRIGLDNGFAVEAMGWEPWTHVEAGLSETVAYPKGI